MSSQYAATFDRKVAEVFTALETDPKKALKIITKEIENRASKLTAPDKL